MGNCNSFIFLRYDCQLPDVRFNFYAISNRSTPDSSRENANKSFGPDENVIHLERSEPHGMMAQISKDLFFTTPSFSRKRNGVAIAVRQHLLWWAGLWIGPS
jgi:hypothetical protein